MNFLSPGQSLGTPNRNSVNGVVSPSPVPEPLHLLRISLTPAIQHTPISQQPPPYQPNEAFNTPVTNSTSGPAPHLSSRAGEPKGLTDIKQESYNPPMSTAPGSSGPAAASNAAAAVANAVPKSREELQQLYDGAQAEIKRLMASASASLGGTGDGGMRQRKGVAADAGAGQSAGGGGAMAVMGQGSASGVPIQITAALCLLSFLIAYLFF